MTTLKAGVATADPITAYNQTNLVSDIPGLAAVTDPNLKNPWGMSFTASSPFWVSDAGTHLATLYNGAGAITSLVVSMPPGFAPTGTVANTTTGFEVTPGNPARFIFAALDGSISGWNPTADGTNAIRKVASTNAVYTGLAIASVGANTFLYAANFKSGHVDVYDANFSPTTLGGNFTDPTLPAGYAPFNIELVGANLYVTYAKVGLGGAPVPGAGDGFVSVFNTNGSFVRRLISRGPLDAPWGIALAPAMFGDFSSDLLIGNFGDGRIDAFDPVTGAFLGALLNPSGNPIDIDGLWALRVRPGGPGVDPNALYFTAGINNEADGLFGKLTVSGTTEPPAPPTPVPEPTSVALLGSGLIAAYRRRCRHARN